MGTINFGFWAKHERELKRSTLVSRYRLRPAEGMRIIGEIEFFVTTRRLVAGDQ